MVKDAHDKVADSVRRDKGRFIEDLYRHLLRRSPKSVELDHWVRLALNGMPGEELFRRFTESEEYKKLHAVSCYHPPGHYYSPIVNPEEVQKNGWVRRNIDPETMPGINLSLRRMTEWWRTNAQALASTPFPDEENTKYRYFANNKIYPIGDAAVFRAMILGAQPKRIIEIGSGFSSACALDAIDEAGLSTVLILIEPYARRLRERLRPRDQHRIVIIEKPVQSVTLDHFENLESGDILFIDSTHVLKTGSDVNYELFSILPSLKPGVLIHFHDMHYPFEYPDDWIFAKNYSWNEIYAVRAFLMYNSEFAVEFMNNLFSQRCQQEIVKVFPRFNSNPGGGLWMRRVPVDDHKD